MKAILIGVWGCIVALGATYGTVMYNRIPTETADSKPKLEIEVVSTRGLSVPMIASGAVQGYVVAQLAYTVQKDALKKLAFTPELLILDEAFKAIYGTETIDFRNLQKQDLTILAGSIRDKINKRFGHGLIEDVLFEELNYVPASDVRGGGKRFQAKAAAPAKASTAGHGSGGH